WAGKDEIADPEFLNRLVASRCQKPGAGDETGILSQHVKGSRRSGSMSCDAEAALGEIEGPSGYLVDTIRVPGSHTEVERGGRGVAILRRMIGQDQVTNQWHRRPLRRQRV